MGTTLGLLSVLFSLVMGHLFGPRLVARFGLRAMLLVFLAFVAWFAFILLVAASFGGAS